MLDFTKDATKKDLKRPSCRRCDRRYRIKSGKTKLPEKLSQGYKRCVRCKKVKEVKDYSGDRTKKDRKYPSCKDCVRKARGYKKKKDGRLCSAGYVREGRGRQHRKMMERILKRKLERHEVVHHKNGVKTDNRPENLEIMSQSEHAKLHARMRRETQLSSPKPTLP